MVQQILNQSARHSNKVRSFFSQNYFKRFWVDLSVIKYGKSENIHPVNISLVSGVQILFYLSSANRALVTLVEAPSQTAHVEGVTTGGDQGQ